MICLPSGLWEVRWRNPSFLYFCRWLHYSIIERKETSYLCLNASQTDSWTTATLAHSDRVPWWSLLPTRATDLISLRFIRNGWRCTTGSVGLTNGVSLSDSITMCRCGYIPIPNAFSHHYLSSCETVTRVAVGYASLMVRLAGNPIAIARPPRYTSQRVGRDFVSGLQCGSPRRKRQSKVPDVRLHLLVRWRHQDEQSSIDYRLSLLLCVHVCLCEPPAKPIWQPTWRWQGIVFGTNGARSRPLLHTLSRPSGAATASLLHCFEVLRFGRSSSCWHTHTAGTGLECCRSGTCSNECLQSLCLSLSLSLSRARCFFPATLPRTNFAYRFQPLLNALPFSKEGIGVCEEVEQKESSRGWSNTGTGEVVRASAASNRERDERQQQKT